MKKTAYIIEILAVLALMVISLAPIKHADAQAYGYGDAFSYYQYPIPWYTYFQTPNATAQNYYPSNYSYANNSGPRYYQTGSNSGCGYYSSGCGSTGGYGYNPGYNGGYGNGYGNGYGFQPTYSGSAPRYYTSSQASNPSFQMSGRAPVTFSYIADPIGSNDSMDW